LAAVLLFLLFERKSGTAAFFKNKKSASL